MNDFDVKLKNINEISVPLYSEKKLEKSTTVEFFQKLYTYPPNFLLKLDPPQKKNHLSINNLINLRKGKLLKCGGRKYDLFNYLNGFRNRVATSKHNASINAVAEKGDPFGSGSVYVILNKSGEIVLAKPVFGTFDQTFKNPLKNIKEKIYNFCGAFEDTKITRESKLGLFFMNKEDAEVYMKEILLKDYQGVSIGGVSVNCISLSSACDLMRGYHPSIDFRFIPDMQEVISLLEINRYTKNVVSIFSRCNESLDPILEQIYHLKDSTNVSLNSFYWDYLNNSNINFNSSVKSFLSQTHPSTWSGVPIYLVNARGSREEKIVYVFFTCLDAENFVNSKKQYVDSFNNGYDLKNWVEFPTQPIWYRPEILVGNFENFFECLYKTENPNESPYKFYFRFGRVEEQEFRLPFHKKYQEDVLRKFRVVKSVCSTWLYR